MLPDRASNPGPLTYESGALPIALRGPAPVYGEYVYIMYVKMPSEEMANLFPPPSQSPFPDQMQRGPFYETGCTAKHI